MRDTPGSAPSPAPSAQLPQQLERPRTLAQIREQISALREKVDAQRPVESTEIQQLQNDVNALPEEEKRKITDDTQKILENLRSGSTLQGNLIALELRFKQLEQGTAERAVAVAGSVVGKGVDKTYEYGKSAVGRAMSLDTYSEVTRSFRDNSWANVFGLGLAGYGIYRLARYIKQKGDAKKRTLFTKVLAGLGIVAIAAAIFNKYGAKAEARAAEIEMQSKGEKEAAEQFMQAVDTGTTLDLFGSEGLANEQINLTYINAPVTVGGSTLQFSRTTPGEVLWRVAGRNFRVSTKRSLNNPPSWMKPDLSNVSSVSRVPNGNLVRFRAKGAEFYVEQSQMEKLIRSLASATAQTSQTILVIKDPTKPEKKQSLALNFELVQPAATQSAGGTGGGTAPVSSSTT